MISKEKENKIIEMYQHDYTYDEIMAAEEIKGYYGIASDSCFPYWMAILVKE